MLALLPSDLLDGPPKTQPDHSNQREHPYDGSQGLHAEGIGISSTSVQRGEQRGRERMSLYRPPTVKLTTGTAQFLGRVHSESSRREISPRGRRKPAYRLVPDSDGSRGPEAARLISRAGLKLDPWQRDVLIDGMATVGESWAADEVCTVVPRQNGKTLALVARALWGPTLGGERLVLFTSHQFKSCREAFLLAKSLCETPPFEPFRPVVSVSHGKEGITFADGSRLLFIARSRTSGRGFSPDCVILDEAFELDDLALAALKPSLAAARQPQLWYASSAPHDTSDVLRRICLKGRSGEASRLVYLEWAAQDGQDPGALGAWRASNPALGTRIAPAFITSELDTLEPADFERERLGRWDEEAGGQWITEETWARCESSDSSGDVVLALAGRDDRAALVGATISDPPHIFVEAVWEGRGKSLPGEEWTHDRSPTVPVLEVEDAVRDACRRYPALRVAMDPARWSRTLQVLQDLPVIEYPLSASRMIPASSRFKEAVENGQLTHPGDGALAQAIGDTRTRTDDRGSRITKDRPLAVAAVVAHDLACDLKAQAFKVW
jgi:phage terminase large subunit-like protein